jgi:adenylosuccinate lyase
MRATDERRDFKTLLLEDADLGKVMEAQDLERVFDLEVHLRHVDRIFERVYREVTV